MIPRHELMQTINQLQDYIFDNIIYSALAEDNILPMFRAK